MDAWEKMFDVIHEECGEDIHRKIVILRQQRSGLTDMIMRDVVTDRMIELYKVSKKPKLEPKPILCLIVKQKSLKQH
jgi:hypothetical protein